MEELTGRIAILRDLGVVEIVIDPLLRRRMAVDNGLGRASPVGDHWPGSIGRHRRRRV